MNNLHLGDSVVVKTGTRDPDLGIDIGGWQGRVEEIYDGGTVLVRWDSITLREMGVEIAIQCENENLDWEVMTLDTADIETTASRDAAPAVARIADVLRAEMMGDPRLDAEEEDGQAC